MNGRKNPKTFLTNDTAAHGPESITLTAPERVFRAWKERQRLRSDSRLIIRVKTADCKILDLIASL